MDPRVARTHDAVLAAATDLLIEGGPAAVTIDGVVARSGVAKSTLYRHWATRDDLLVAVLRHNLPNLEPIPAHLSFDQALDQLARTLVELVRDPHWNRVLLALLLLRNQLGEVADLEQEAEDQQVAVMVDVLRRGVEEGRLSPSVLDDRSLSVTLLAGPLLLAGLTGLVAVDARLADRVVHQFVAGHAGPATGSERG